MGDFDESTPVFEPGISVIKVRRTFYQELIDHNGPVRMELDVSLKRTGDEPWGFRLGGGADCNMPLTVVKVVPDSPADLADLRDGDAVISINGADASAMTHEESKVALAAAADYLQLGVVRGLYDPVLDDYDPIYEPIDQEDFDQPSQPTEVPDSLDLTLTLPEFADTAPKDGANGVFKPLPDLIGQDPRSLTASPFVLPTKPYRPFSTEPVPEIPSLEDPIILNPNYHEEFGRLKDEEEFLPKPRFKLPISEQYDPDGTKQKMKLEALRSKDVIVKDLVTAVTESKTTKTETIAKEDIEMKDQVMTKQEVKFLEKMKKEIDLETIEKTATSIVHESIEKAVTVAEEIKKEIDIELRESSDREIKSNSVKETTAVSELKSQSSKDSSIVQETASKVKLESKETAIKEETELVDLVNKTTNEIVNQKEHKEEKKTSLIEDVTNVVDLKQSERHVSKSDKTISDKVEVTESSKSVQESQDIQRKISVQECKTDKLHQKETRDKTQSETSTRDSKSETRYSTAKLLSEQRAYTIGLQTIPNIRGTVHSSYHYNLLLNTFFIHLTDVMVALSRFILTETVLSKPVEETKQDISERQEVCTETTSKTKESESVSVDKKEDIKTAAKEKVDQTASRLVTPAKKERVVGKILQKAHEIKQQDDQETAKIEQKNVIYEENYQSEMKHFDEHLKSDEIIVKRRDLSGSRMAQLTEKKPEELMQNMENVLTEFESKSTNEDIEVVRERRSRSRSTVVTPVDMILSDKYNQEISQHSSLTTSAISSSISESKTSKTSESGYESTDFETIDGAKTYVAIVQSHVYTNKDAIFEAASLQCVEETTTNESVETESMKKVESSIETTEKAVQAVVETATKIVAAEKEEQVVEKIETKAEEVTKEVEKVIENDTTSVKTAQNVIIQEITEPMVEEIQSKFIQDYTVTEAQEEIEVSKSEEEKVLIIEESAAKETTTLVKEDSVSMKEEISTHKQYVTASDTIELNKEPIVVQEILTVETVKEELVAAKEDIATIKEQSTIVNQTEVEETVSLGKKEEEEVFSVHSFRKDLISDDTSKQSVCIKQDLKISKEETIENEKSVVGIEEQVDHIETKHIEQESTFIAKSMNQKSNFVAKSLDVNIEEVTINESKITSEIDHIISKPIEQESTFVAKSYNQESSFIGKSLDVETKEIQRKLSLDLTDKKRDSYTFEDGDLLKTPTPCTVPPTPLTDEYVFSLTAKLPKREGPPIPRDCTPSDNEDEDPHIVKKGLVPNIEANIEDQKIFDPPLPSPPTSPKSLTSPKSIGLKGGSTVIPIYTKPPVYYKPGLKGGSPMSPRFSMSKNPMYIKPNQKEDQDEDPHIVKKDYIPNLEAKVVNQKVDDVHPPTSPERLTSPKSFEIKEDSSIKPNYTNTPVYHKPGLKGGAPVASPVQTQRYDEDEDPHIVKKGLVPNAKVDQKVFHSPLPSPSPKYPAPQESLESKKSCPVVPIYTKTPVYCKPGLRGGAPITPRISMSKHPVYIKPGLKGGVADPEYSKEEIKEIELKSSLLASAIDETIKSIEEYKEEVGLKKRTTSEYSKEVKTKDTFQNGVMYNGYAKVVETKIFNNTADENNNNLDTLKDTNFVVNGNNAVENGIKKENTQVLSNGVCERIMEPTESKIDIPSDVTQVSPLVETEPPSGNITETKPVQAINFEVPNYVVNVEEKRDPIEGYRPVPFDPEELNARERRTIKIPYLSPSQERELYKTSSGDIIGTHQGIVDGLEEAVVDTEVAKEMGKPGITEEKIAELISGEAEMLREAHVMGLSRVISSHMRRDGDDCSVDFKKIKPIVESLKDSEVLKALNEELLKDAEERKKKEAKKEAWTTFLQKPRRPVPKSKFGYYKDMEEEQRKIEPYKPKIVKQPKPKVAPDYKPKDFNTGLLPWEERALREPTPPPVEPEDPILIPEEAPEILEAVDPLPESEVPDLEDSGIPLPPSPEPKEATPPPEDKAEEEEELNLEAVIEETEKIVEENLVEEMEGGNIANQIMTSVQNMVDPSAPLEQQLAQMRAQLSALAQLPGVIQQSLELVTRQLAMLATAEAEPQPAIQDVPESDMTPAAVEETEVSENGGTTIEEIQSQDEEPQSEPVDPPAPTLTAEELEKMRKEEELMLEEQRRMEKQKKELMEQARIEHESRQLKQRPTPRVGNPLPDPRVGTPQPNQRGNGKPTPAFGPLAPSERPVVLPGGRKWRTPKDAYNEAFIAETLQAQAELIAGKVMGLSYESVLLPYDQRVNFMKYEKPPVSLDHLKDSDVYKMIHNMEMVQPKRVEMLTPVIAEADYREKCRSMTPCPERLAQQIQP